MPLRLRTTSASGFSLQEMIIVVTFLGVLAAMAAPPLQRMRERAALQNGRHLVTSALALARTSGVQWGGTSVLRIDSIADELRIVVDTGGGTWGSDTLLVRRYALGDLSGLALESDVESLCFNSRGVGTRAARCPEAGARIVLRHAGGADTLRVSTVGRVLP